jgi:hypothetical protein
MIVISPDDSALIISCIISIIVSYVNLFKVNGVVTLLMSLSVVIIVVVIPILAITISSTHHTGIF